MTLDADTTGSGPAARDAVTASTANPSATAEATPPAEAPPATTPARRRGWRRPLAVIGQLMLSSLLLSLLLVALALGTQTGTRLTLALIDEALAETLTLEGVGGRLIGKLTIASLRLRLPGFGLDGQTLEWQWSPLALLDARLSVRRLAIGELDLWLTADDSSATEPLTLPEILLPLEILLADGRLERLRLFQAPAEVPLPDHATPLHAGAAQTLLEVARIRLRARLTAGQLEVDELAAALSEPPLEATLSGQAALLDQYPLQAALDWRLAAQPPADPAAPAATWLSGSGTLDGDLRGLTIHQELDGWLEARLEARVETPLEALHWDARLRLARLDAVAAGWLAADMESEPDGFDPRVLALTADVRSQGSLDDARLEGEASLRLPAGSLPLDPPLRERELDLALDVALRWTDSRLAVERLDVALEDGASGIGPLHLAGEVDLSAPESPRWRFDLHGETLNLDPLLPATLPDALAELASGANPRTLLDLRLNSHGGLDAFDYRLESELSGGRLPDARLALAGQGSQSRIALRDLSLAALGAELSGQAEVAWSPALEWSAALALSALDPSRLLPEWPGRLDGRVTARGAMADDGAMTLDAGIEALNGELRGHPLALNGRVTSDGTTWRFEGIALQSGATRAQADGTLGERLDLAFALNSPDLSALWPGARGSLGASGQVAGALAAPRLALDLRGRDLALEEHRIAALEGDIDVDLAPNGALAVRLTATGLDTGGLLGERLTLDLSGTRAAHRFEAALTGTPLALTLGLNGGLDAAGHYQGRLGRLDLEANNLGRWTLREPATLRWAGTEFGFSEVCLREQEISRVCLAFTQPRAGAWEARLAADPLDLGLAAPFLPETLDLTGQARLRADLRAANGQLAGSAVLEVPRGRLGLSDEGALDLDFSGARLTLTPGTEALSARLDLPLADLGRVDGEASLPGWRLDAPAAPGQPLRGTLRGELPGLAAALDNLTDLSRVSGHLSWDLSLAGRLDAPTVAGQARLTDFGFDLPLTGLSVRNLSLRAAADGAGRLQMDGEGRVGDGTLTVGGTGRLSGGDLAARIEVQGERLRVANTSEYFAELGANVALDLSPEGIAASGEVRVREARIRPRALPAGTRMPSADVILLGQEPSRPLPLSLDLRLSLTDNVMLDAFGVRGRLAGDLRLSQTPGRELLGDGQLRVIDGQYRFSGGLGIVAEVGAPLTITQGRLIFANTPVANPGLLLQAERVGGDTTAGVRIIGTARDPQLTFFSESDPGMTQAQITQYLLTGVSPAQQGAGPDASLAFGTYIAPQLFMEYQSGLGDSGNRVRLRYQLNRHLEIQTETGRNQGGDIFWTFER